ncbi:MAG: hypothetical protein PVI18_13400 [Desulfobacterales bacterium]
MWCYQGCKSWICHGLVLEDRSVVVPEFGVVGGVAGTCEIYGDPEIAGPVE